MIIMIVPVRQTFFKPRVSRIVTELIESFELAAEDRRLRSALTKCTHTGTAPEWSLGFPALIDYVKHLMAQRAGNIRVMHDDT